MNQIGFTGYQDFAFDPTAKNQNEIVVWWIMTPDRAFYQHTPKLPYPKVIAKSWGAKISARDAVVQLFNVVPFYYNVYTDVVDTPKGLNSAIKRLRTPESLFEARKKRINKKLQQTDPLFYSQMIDDVLSSDPYTVDFYKKRQSEKQKLIASVAAKPEDVGKLWINPKAAWMAQYDWHDIHDELSIQVRKFDVVYKAWDFITDMFDIRNKELDTDIKRRQSEQQQSCCNAEYGLASDICV